MLQMADDLKKRLKNALKERSMSIPKLEGEIGIPRDRMYAWYRDNTNPKKEDQDKLEKWISGEIFNTEELNALVRKLEEKNIQAEAHLEVFGNTLAMILAGFDPLVFASKQADLKKAVEEAVNRRLAELNKKQK